ncbi:hypothetical protein B566_EDAN008613 [Ephemera danica]|nr:hypothetical protein B566_EDAN008613 [Ephemera danica]
MTDDDVVVLGSSSSRGIYGGVGASAVPPPRMPLASKQDDVEVVFEGLSPVKASTSMATTNFAIHEEKESDSDIKELESIIVVPHKNTLAESLCKKKIFDDSWVPGLVESFNEKAKSLDEERKRECERLELLKAKSKEQFQDNHVDRLRKQIEIFDLAKEEEEIEEVEEEFPQLSAQAEDIVDRAFIPTPPSEVLVSASNQNITRRDISTLKGLQWLNDEKVLQYLIDEARDKKKEVFDTTDWQLITAKDIPHQMNGSDCGMFSCMFAETVSRRKKINFTQDHMPYFRRRMVYEILTKQLLS